MAVPYPPSRPSTDADVIVKATWEDRFGQTPWTIAAEAFNPAAGKPGYVVQTRYSFRGVQTGDTGGERPVRYARATGYLWVKTSRVVPDPNASNPPPQPQRNLSPLDQAKADTASATLNGVFRVLTDTPIDQLPTVLAANPAILKNGASYFRNAIDAAAELLPDTLKQGVKDIANSTLKTYEPYINAAQEQAGKADATGNVKQGNTLLYVVGGAVVLGAAWYVWKGKR